MFTIIVPGYPTLFNTKQNNILSAIRIKKAWLDNQNVNAVILDPDGYIVSSSELELITSLVSLSSSVISTI